LRTAYIDGAVNVRTTKNDATKKRNWAASRPTKDDAVFYDGFFLFTF